jgi:hypothetical protein
MLKISFLFYILAAKPKKVPTVLKEGPGQEI